MDDSIRDEDIIVTPAMIEAGEDVYYSRDSYFDGYFEPPTPMVIALFRAMVRASIEERAQQSAAITDLGGERST